MNQSLQPVANLPVKTGIDHRMGSLLVAQGKLTAADTERILRRQTEQDIRFGQAARELGLVTEDDIAQVLARQFKYPYLIPGQGRLAPELVAAYQPFGSQADSLRAVSSRLRQRWFSAGRKALAVACVGPQQGASLFAANLALVFAQACIRTLLIDANLRAPRQHELFDLQQRQGLSDLLIGRRGTELVARIDPFEDLYVLGAGTVPPNPQELLNRPAFGELTARVGSQFNVVLLDVPALSRGEDAVAVAAHAGGVLLVVRRDHTPLEEVHRAIARMRSARVAVVGCVMVDY